MGTGCSPGKRDGKGLRRTKDGPPCFPFLAFCLSVALEQLHSTFGGGGNTGNSSVPFGLPQCLLGQPYSLPTSPLAPAAGDLGQYEWVGEKEPRRDSSRRDTPQGSSDNTLT